MQNTWKPKRRAILSFLRREHWGRRGESWLVFLYCNYLAYILMTARNCSKGQKSWNTVKGTRNNVATGSRESAGPADWSSGECRKVPLRCRCWPCLPAAVSAHFRRYSLALHIIGIHKTITNHLDEYWASSIDHVAESINKACECEIEECIFNK